MVTCIFQCYSLNPFHSLLPLLCPKVCSLMVVFLLLACKLVQQYHVSTFRTYALIHKNFFFLTHFTLCNKFWVHHPQFNWLKVIPLRESNVPLHICTTTSLSIHLLMNIKAVSTSWLLQTVLQGISSCMHHFEWWFSPVICLGGGLMGHVIALFLVFSSTDLLPH